MNIYIYILNIFQGNSNSLGMRRCASYSVHLKMRGEILQSHTSEHTVRCGTLTWRWNILLLLEDAGSWFSFWKVCKVPASVPKVSTRVVEPVSWSSLSVPGQQKRIEDIEGYCIEGDNYGNQFTVPHILIHTSTYGEPQGKMKASGSSNDSNKLSPNASH